MVDEGNLFRKAKRDNIPFIVYQIFTELSDEIPPNGDFTTMGHSERSRTRRAPKYEAEPHCRKISTSSG